jgi:hypothetical protein
MAMNFDPTKERLDPQPAATIALLLRPGCLLVGEKFRIAKELLKQSTRVLVESRAQSFLQPLDGTAAKPLLAHEPLAR